MSQTISEKSRSTESRLYEHQRCLKTDLLTHGGVTEYDHHTGHKIHLDSTSVLAKSPRNFSRIMREVLENSKILGNLNQYDR